MTVLWSDVTVDWFPSGSAEPDSVDVSVRHDFPLIMASMIGQGTVRLTAHSTMPVTVVYP